MDNPLLAQHDLPAFSEIRPEHVEPAIDSLIAEGRAAVERLLAANTRYTWENLVYPLEAQEDRLARAWAPVRHLNSVRNSEELRAAYNACLSKLSDWGTELGHHEGLYRAYRAMTADPALQTLAPAQRKTLEDALRDFHLSGVDLPAQDKQRFKAIEQELSALQSKFEENLLDATHAWRKHISDPAMLDGLPRYALDMARQAAEREDLEGYLVNLEMPSYLAVMTYAKDRRLRREVYEAYTTRASAEGPGAGQWDNTPVMERIVALRQEKARLLGFSSYAELSLATKMASSVEEVMGFLRDLAARAKPLAERELEELTSFAREQLGLDQVQAWDLAWCSEKLKHTRYEISDQQLKPYFPAPSVISGLFGLTERLFGVRIREREGVDTWHPDVRFYEIVDEDGTLRGRFYVDLYARSRKRGGAWMDECVNRMHRPHGVQTPVAFLVCNFTPPLGDKPALLTHDEVLTLFHEFGHGLHHMLTRVDYPAVSGINGVEWDAVELPSQFMENWCWEREALDLFARHHQSGERLPEPLYRRMIAAKNFQAAMQMLRQLEFALFDMRLYSEYRGEPGQIQHILDEVRSEVAVIKPPAFNRFQNGFSHIFGGGYAAGYYSYKWAEVLSADAFARFEEEGLFKSSTGHDFLQHILERGGSEPAMDLFRRFRGREPSIEALLRHNGIVNDLQESMEVSSQ
jgi:oligopeptidase A